MGERRKFSMKIFPRTIFPMTDHEEIASNCGWRGANNPCGGWPRALSHPTTGSVFMRIAERVASLRFQEAIFQKLTRENFGSVGFWSNILGLFTRKNIVDNRYRRGGEKKSVHNLQVFRGWMTFSFWLLSPRSFHQCPVSCEKIFAPEPFVKY
jgi:hypothetical protein